MQLPFVGIIGLSDFNNPQSIYKNIISLLENKSASENNSLVSLPGDYNEHRVIQYTYKTTFKS